MQERGKRIELALAFVGRSLAIGKACLFYLAEDAGVVADHKEIVGDQIHADVDAVFEALQEAAIVLWGTDQDEAMQRVADIAKGVGHAQPRRAQGTALVVGEDAADCSAVVQDDLEDRGRS